MYNAKQFKSAVNTIKKTGAKLDDLIHNAACFAVFHSIKDGQITPAQDLISAMPNSGRRSNLISWLCLYGNLSWVQGKLKSVAHHGNKFKPGTSEREIVAFEQYEIALDNPFWFEFEDAPIQQKPFDFDAKLIALLHQAKIVQAGQSAKFDGLADSKFMQMIRNNLPGEVLTKVDTIKENGKTKDIVPPVKADQVSIAA